MKSFQSHCKESQFNFMFSVMDLNRNFQTTAKRYKSVTAYSSLSVKSAMNKRKGKIRIF